MSVVRDRSESGAWPLSTNEVTFGLNPLISEIPGVIVLFCNAVCRQEREAPEGRGKNRSVMPLDGMGCTRTTVVTIIFFFRVKSNREGMSTVMCTGTRNC